MRIIFFFTLLSFSVFSQENTTPKMLFELGVGGNNETKMMERWVAKNNDSAFFITSTGVNPISFKWDFINRSKFQFGFEFMYNRVTLYYFENSYLDEYNLLKTPTIMEDIQKFKWMLRASYLFPASTNKLQYYSSVSFGMSFVNRFNIIYDTPSEISDTEPINTGPFLFNSPITFKVYLGTRYYFSKNFGVHLEAGFGGAIMNGGLTFRFGNKEN